MAHEDLILKDALKLRVFNRHTGVYAMGSRCPWKAGVSQVNNYYKGCMNLVKDGELEKCDGFFRVPGCKSEYKEHAQKLSQNIAEFLRLPNLDVTVYREKTISEIGVRPDATIFLRKFDKGLVFFLETCIKENQKFLDSKVNALLAWNGATRYLSELFNVKVPFFQILIDGDLKHSKALPLESFLEEVRDEK